MPAQRVKVKRRVSERTGKVNYTAQWLHPDMIHWISAGTYSQRAVARLKAMTAYEESRKPGWVDPRGSTTLLDAFAEEHFWPSLQVGSVNTLITYRSLWRNHIAPVFGNRELGSIQHSEIGRWLNGIKRGQSTKRQAFVILNMVFKQARKNHLIIENPCDDIIRPTVPVGDVEIFTTTTWPKFWAEVPEEYRLLVWVVVKTGLRMSEVRGLCPAQIKWSSRALVVDRQVIEIKSTITDDEVLSRMAAETGEGVEGYVITRREGAFVWVRQTKSKRKRTIPIDAAVLTALDGEPVVATLLRLAKRRGLSATGEEEFFPLFYRRDASKFMTETCRGAGIPHRTFHDLRATYASWRLRETGDIIRVQQELGHADLKTTQRYLGVVDDVEVDESASFEAMLAELDEEAV